ncbi:hypothetical protein COU59_02480 [Candidatus Pacearchaeota archaeon CG10_big_fil_rev_8_21_14_0_10_34_12]|nr:MAG: hypothetical protein COU59_02480 [Candidatus Pacearchaeota archaeon CG10_big_fil_rev_8_21_14_0_10_34_12]
MNHIFEVIDKTGRKIRLTKKQWNHISTKHPIMSSYLREIEETINNPDKIVLHERGNLFDYYKYYKHKEGKFKFLKTVIKYLNGDGFILSAYFVAYIN